MPEMSDERLEELASRIKPVVRFVETVEGHEQHPRGFLYYVECLDPRDDLYWFNKPVSRAEDLEELGFLIASRVVFHKQNDPSSVKYPLPAQPLVVEVLAQIPERYLSEAVAFEMKPYYVPVTIKSHDSHIIAFGADIMTSLYKRSKKK